MGIETSKLARYWYICLRVGFTGRGTRSSTMDKLLQQSAQYDVKLIKTEDISEYLKESAKTLESYITEVWVRLFCQSGEYEVLLMDEFDQFIQKLEKRMQGLSERKNSLLGDLEALSKNLRPANSSRS